MFKKALLALPTVLIFVVVASAQTDWNGFYAAEITASSVATLENSGRQKLSADAFTGGLEAGANAQSGSIVFGGELDYESLRLNDSASSTVDYPCCAGTSFTLDQSFKTTWLFTARPRIGVAMGPSLFYATGGLAVTKVDYQAQFTDTFASASEGASVNKAKYGWVGGFGIAFKGADKHFSIKGEYLYTDFGRLTMTASNLTAFTPPTSYPENEFTHSMALHAHVIRAGVDYYW